MTEELKIIISAEIDKLKKAIAEGTRQVDNFGDDAEKNSNRVSQAMQKAGDVTKKVFAVMGGAIIGATTALVALSESTKEYRQHQAQLKTAFETAGGSAEDAKNTYNELYRVLGDSGKATEAGQHLAKLTNNEKDLAEWTNICKGVYAQFGDSLAIEGLTEAVNHTAKLGEVQGTLADALEWSGVNVDEFNDQLFWCNSESEREQLIRDTLNGLYSESAELYEQNNAQVLNANEAQARLNEALAKAGEVVTPLVTILKGGLATALLDLTPHLDTVSKGLEDVINGVEGGAERMSEGIQGIIESLLNTITSTLPTLIRIGIDILKSLIQGIAQALPDLVTTVNDIIPVILSAIGELLPLLISAILNALPSIADCILKAVAQIITIIGDILPDIVIAIIEIVPLLVDSIVANIPILINAAVQFLMAIIQAIPRIIPPLLNSIPTIINSIVNALIDNAPLLFQASVTLFMEIVKSIPKIIPELLKGLANLVKSVKDNLVNKLKSLLSFKWELPKLKLPSIGVEWKQSPAWLAEAAKFIGLQGIPKFSVTWNARGGVFDKPAIMSYGNSLQGLGENGAEAIVPLENNLEWLNKLASMLGDRMGSTPVVLNVDGKTFAKTSIKSINQLTKQTGKLDLVLA